MPALTVIMDSTVCFLNNLVPVYVDINPDTFLIDPSDLEKKITEKSKVVITVSLYGNIPNMDKISEIAKKNKLFIIDDNAQGVLAKQNGKQLEELLKHSLKIQNIFLQEKEEWLQHQMKNLQKK